jgi:hypothetical protein
MAEKATFDGPQKIITINFGETEIIAQRDLYSAWKRWTTDQDNAKYLQAFRTVGGDVIGVGQAVSAYFFLLNGWRVRSWEGDHFLTVDGNLFVEGGGSPFISLLGDFQVVISLVVSPQSITNTVTVTAGVLSDQDKEDITSGVWSEPSSAGGDDTMGELQRDIKTDTSLIPGTV